MKSNNLIYEIKCIKLIHLFILITLMFERLKDIANRSEIE